MKRLVIALLLCLLPGLLPAGTAFAEPTPQAVASNEAIGTTHVEIARGHIDLGPRIIDGQWVMLARDDTVSPPVWRQLSDVTMRVGDQALMAVPNDPGYAFLPQGKKVHVVPQTQDPGVVWVGWSTQDPAVVAQLDRGAWLTYRSASGPGRVTTFVANGFDAPSVLWDSAKGPGQRFWVNANTHTHINWVFEAPGEYRVDLDVVAKKQDGTELKVPAQLHFLVGDATKPGEKQAPASASSAQPQAAPASSAPVWWWVIGGAGVVFAGLVVVRLVASRRAVRGGQHDGN